MAFFDFLKKPEAVAKKVFSFIPSSPSLGGIASKVVEHNKDKVASVATSAARGVIKTGVSAGISAAHYLAPEMTPDVIHVNNPIAQKIFGKEDIQGYTSRYQGLQEDFKKKGLGVASVPLALLGTGTNAALDLTGAGGAEKAGEKSLAEQLAKEVTENGVKTILKKAGVKVTDDTVKALAHTKDRNVAENILSGSNKIPNPPPVMVPPPKEIPKPPKPIPNPEIARLDNEIKVKEQLIKHAPTDQAAAKLHSEAGDLIKQRGDINATAPEVLPSPSPNQVPTPTPVATTAGESVGRGSVSNPAALTRPPVGQDIVSATVPKQVQYGTYESAQRATGLSDSTKKGIAAIEPQTHAQRSTKELGDRVSAIIQKDPEAARNKLYGVGDEEFGSAEEKVATANKLLEHYSSLGTEAGDNQAVRIATDLAQNNLGLGRAVQANKVIERLSPAGVIKFGEKVTRKAREAVSAGGKIKKAGGETGVAKEIQDAVEGATTVEKGNVTQAVRDVASGKKAKVAEDLTTGEKVAKRVENAVTPQVKKKADTLVEELTRKIKQEQLTPLPKAGKKSPTDILREVFGRNPEAQEAYPEAQRILREKFADNPQALKTLDNFFNSELGLPAASSTINSAIKEQLVKNEEKISAIIHKSWNGQKQSVDDVAAALTKEGFDEQSAKTIAKEVTDRLSAQVSDAKKAALEKLAKDAPKSAQATYLDKIKKLSNLGGLDDSDYLALARSKLNLPDLSPEIAGDVSKLAQQMQGLPDGPEKDAIVSKIMSRLNDAIPVTKGEKFDAYRYQNLLSGPRTQARNTIGNLFNTLVTRPATIATQASTDWVRAGLTGKERETYLKEVPAYYKGLFNSTGDALEAMKGAWKGTAAIEQPDLANIKAFRSDKLPKKYTVVSRAMEAQDKFFQTLISSGEYAVQKSKGAAEDVAKAEAERVAKYSLFRNATDAKNATGQGTLLSKIDQFTDTVNKVGQEHKSFRWFVPFVKTPMNIAKQFIEFSPAGFATLKGASGARKSEQIAKAMIGSTVTGIGAKFAMDGHTTWAAPTNAKEREAFYAAGKKPYSINIGGKWVPMIYFGPFAYSLALPAAVKDSNDHAPLDASVLKRVTDAAANQAKFFGQQTYVQGISNFIDAASGNTDSSTLASLGSTLGQAIPLSGLQRYIAGIVDPVQRKQKGIVQGIQSGTPFASKGLESYTDAGTGQPAKRNITDYTLPYTVGIPTGTKADQAKHSAYDEFYKVRGKTGSTNTKTNDAINKALGEGDMSKARQLATDYNKKYSSAFDDWRSKYKTYADATLLKEYNSNKINLTSASIKARLKAIKEKS